MHGSLRGPWVQQAPHDTGPSAATKDGKQRQNKWSLNKGKDKLESKMAIVNTTVWTDHQDLHRVFNLQMLCYTETFHVKKQQKTLNPKLISPNAKKYNANQDVISDRETQFLQWNVLSLARTVETSALLQHLSESVQRPVHIAKPNSGLFRPAQAVKPNNGEARP